MGGKTAPTTPTMNVSCWKLSLWIFYLQKCQEGSSTEQSGSLMTGVLPSTALNTVMKETWGGLWIFFFYFLLSRGFLYARSKTKNCVLTVCLSALMWGCVLDAKVADELISCVFKTRLDMTHITIIGLIKVRIWASQLIRLSWTKSPYMLDQHIWWDSLILRFVPCCND